MSSAASSIFGELVAPFSEPKTPTLDEFVWLHKKASKASRCTGGARGSSRGGRRCARGGVGGAPGRPNNSYS